MGVVVFEVKKGAPTSFTLPQREVMAEKPGTGELKHIAYFRGQGSIFKEDITNKDLKPSKVPSFELNITRNKCEVRIDERDKNLVQYYLTHPWYGKKYVMYSEDIASKEKLGKAEAIEKALDYIKESDETRIKALGLAVLGIESYNRSMVSIKADLKEKAINKPQEVIAAREDALFDNKFLASLAICSGIVKTNNTMTAIVWADNDGSLLNIATGEDFITKFAKHLGGDTPESKTLLQEIGNRLKVSKKETESKVSENSEIAELKAKLAEAERARKEAESKLTNNKQEPTLDELDLKELQEKYLKATGKDTVPFAYSKNIEWLNKKIAEAEQA